MKTLFFVVVTLSMVIYGCKTSKHTQKNPIEPSPSVEQTLFLEEPIVIESEKPIMVKIEQVTMANKEDEGMNMFDYYVIIGSFQNPENASKLQSHQVKKGFLAVVLKSETGMLRVAVNGTNVEAEARKLIKDIRVKSPEHKDVWLLKRK